MSYPSSHQISVALWWFWAQVAPLGPLRESYALGGHTAELLSYVSQLPPVYSPRIYVVASTDELSGIKAQALEKDRENLPRAREVGQSYLTSVFTTCIAIVASVLIVLRHRPRLVLCNGPGTCVPICLVAKMAQPFIRGSTTIVFVESVCRTRSLSVSGRLLYHFRVARVIVQWPYLLQAYPRATYLGLLS
uniref:UDP-N-acetylglucosamine transferase subunit ALG14 n=1 Tax=Mesocestoides corti TaxID=53468 RepID=A0A5K3FM61_MESCO